jgi:hypothetical protein
MDPDPYSFKPIIEVMMGTLISILTISIPFLIIIL